MHLRGFEELAITAPSHPVRFGTTFRRGTPLVFVNVPLGNPGAQVSLEVTYDVEFDRSSGPESVRGEPVVRTLDRIRDEIYGRVLPALEGHLPPD